MPRFDRRLARRWSIVVALAAIGLLASDVQAFLDLPLRAGSIRFAVIGDGGNGSAEQRDVAARMVEKRKSFPFQFVIMLGDNLYGDQGTPVQLEQKLKERFERPYKVLLDDGVKFYASLGNHDSPNQRYYTPFNMGGEYYYSTVMGDHQAIFIAIDSDRFDGRQRGWLEKTLAESKEPWKICFFHHPLYSSGGRHGSDPDLRGVIEPLLIQYGVSVVFAGHDHFYERIEPQQGIAHFVSGAAGQLRQGNIRRTGLTAKGFDTDRHFMAVEIAGDEMHFEAISRAGQVIDSGVVRRRGAPPVTP